MLTWSMIVVAMALPFWASAAAMLAGQLAERAEPGQATGATAGAWLAGVAPTAAPGVRLEVHDVTGADAYWPSVDTIALSRSTWRAAGPRSRAIAAHELGHALNTRAHWVGPHLSPFARWLEATSWRGVGAALVVFVVTGEPVAAALALGFAFASVAGGFVVVADEAAASGRALGWLAAVEAPADRRIVLQALAGSWWVYGARWLAQLGVIAALPALLDRTAGLPRSDPGGAIFVPGAILLLLAAPTLALRVAHVADQVLRPTPVDSDTRLQALTFRDAQWEGLSALLVGLIVLALHDHGSGPVYAAGLVLAGVVALGPPSDLGRLAVWWPVVIASRRLLGGLPFDTLAGDPGDRAIPAMRASYARPPWYLRLAWAAHLMWLPWVAMVIRELLGRGWWPT